MTEYCHSTKSLSDVLQEPQLDLARAADFVLGTISTLEGFRLQHAWSHTFQYTLQVASHLEIEANISRVRQKELLDI